MGGSKPVRNRTGLGTLQASSGLAATTWSRPSLAATTGCPDGHASVTMRKPSRLAQARSANGNAVAQEALGGEASAHINGLERRGAMRIEQGVRSQPLIVQR